VSRIIPIKTATISEFDGTKVFGFMCTSFVRGITLDHSIVIVDECQTINDMEINSIMTRVGVNTKIIFVETSGKQTFTRGMTCLG
jgi:predicted ribonuclease YlaK